MTARPKYVSDTGSVFMQAIAALQTWRGLTPRQRDALVHPDEPMHPRVRRELRLRQLLRMDGTRSRWGDVVLDVTGRKRAGTRWAS